MGNNLIYVTPDTKELYATYNKKESNTKGYFNFAKVITDISDLNERFNGKLERKIVDYENLTVTNGYLSIESFNNLGLDATKDKIISMNIRGFSSVSKYPISLAKSSDGVSIFVMASNGTTIGRLTVEYWILKGLS